MNSKCSLLSYYECLIVQIIHENETGNYNFECLPESIKSIRSTDLSEVDTCDSSQEQDIWDYVWEIYEELNDEKCPKLCTTQEYVGKIDYTDEKSVSKTDPNLLILYLRYSRPRTVSLFEEYLIYDSIGMVGSVGGTLGMFIGFSFYDIVVRMANFFR